MGINLVTIVENSKGISLEGFLMGLQSDTWGQFGLGPDSWHEDEEPPWEVFEWEGKRYFAWLGSPREPQFELWEHEEPEHNCLRVRLFRIFRVIERLAGGPIYVGNDVIDPPCPEGCKKFFLPQELDSLWPTWREIADSEEVDEEQYLVW